MATDSPLLSPAERLAALARAFYATRPRTTPPRYSELVEHTVSPPRPPALGRALAPLFVGSYVQRACDVEWGEETSGTRRTLAKLRRDDPTAADYVTSELFADRVSRVLCHLPEPGPEASSGLRDAVRHARKLAAHGTRSTWVREVARAIAAEMPELTDDVTLYRDGSPVARSAWTPDYRREYDRERRGPSRDALTTAAAWVLDWRSDTPPAAYKTAEVHQQYRSEVPAPDQVSRTRFHRVAAHPSALGPPVRRASGRLYLVQEATEMTKEERRQLAELIVDKLTDEWRAAALDGLADMLSERQAEKAAPAAKATAGNVISLSARRARRAA